MDAFFGEVLGRCRLSNSAGFLCGVDIENTCFCSFGLSGFSPMVLAVRKVASC